MSKISRKKKQKRKEDLRIKGLLPKDVCDSCHNEFLVEELIYGPDPFAHEILGGKKKVTLCERCHYESCMDI